MNGGTFNIGNAIAQGMQMRQALEAREQQAQMNALMAEHGAGAMQGQPNSLAAIMQANPMLGFKIQGQIDDRRRAEETHRMKVEQHGFNTQISQQQLADMRQQAASRARDEAAKMSAAEREREYAQLTALAAEGRAAAREGEEAWLQFVQRNASDFQEAGADPAELTFANAVVALTGIVGTTEGLEAAIEFTDGFKPQAPKRNIIKGADGYNYYEDTRERVLPGVQKAPEVQQPSAKEQQINRLVGQGLDLETATLITDGVLVTSRNEETGEVEIINKATGAPHRSAQQRSPVAPAPEVAAPAAESPRFSFGPQFENADRAGGIGGFARKLTNTGADAVGLDMPFPETAQAQSDFANFGEGIIATVAAGYNRQPPSWLLQNIRDLAPQPGVFEGPQATQNKLRALGREMQSRRAAVASQLGRRMMPAERQTLQGQISALDAGMAQIEQAIRGFSHQIDAETQALIDELAGG